MSISAISNPFSSIGYAPAINPLSPPLAQNGADASQTVGASSGGGQSAGGFGQSVMLALQMSGINVSASSAAGESGPGAVGGASGETLAGAAQQALHTFVHAVYQAVQAESFSSGDPGGGLGSPSDGYGAFQDNLQKLLQDVGNGVQSSATQNLASAFRDLQHSLGGSAAASMSRQGSLHDFLQNLVTLQNSPLNSSGALGSLVNTSA
ncbi:hypothetical protein [Chromobacterium vaccinii]|uniref:Harpin HrpZ n=2 Tax=Chromobacterium vaccinii TaxID=1108595 RepID=A0ABV0FET0_9NEIS